jgi:hypothetical protein
MKRHAMFALGVLVSCVISQPGFAAVSDADREAFTYGSKASLAEAQKEFDAETYHDVFGKKHELNIRKAAKLLRSERGGSAKYHEQYPPTQGMEVRLERLERAAELYNQIDLIEDTVGVELPETAVVYATSSGLSELKGCVHKAHVGSRKTECGQFHHSGWMGLFERGDRDFSSWTHSHCTSSRAVSVLGDEQGRYRLYEETISATAEKNHGGILYLNLRSQAHEQLKSDEAKMRARLQGLAVCGN